MSVSNIFLPNISPADCQKTSDELRLAAGTTEIPPGQQVAGQTCSIVDQGADQLQVKCGSDTFYMTRGSSTLYLARRLGLSGRISVIDDEPLGLKTTENDASEGAETVVDIIDDKADSVEKDTSEAPGTAYSRVVEEVDDDRELARLLQQIEKLQTGNNIKRVRKELRRMRRIRTLEEVDDDRELARLLE